ncbi:MAG: hypothetical protein ABW157_05415 [Candidatus Thiodiazotropha sp. LLP2]
MMIRIAETDKEIQQYHALMQLLRPDIDSTQFLDRVRQQQRATLKASDFTLRQEKGDSHSTF